MARHKLGFKQAFIYILDLFCYSYYVKHDNLISDQGFDELEKLYCKIFEEKYAPSRAKEKQEDYSHGVQVVYNFIKGEK
jgi:hypothetical protein